MDLTVKTTKGPVEGFASEGIRKWFGIPFAQPPVGPLRFKRAREAEPWETVKPCKVMGPSPIQFGVEMPGMVPSETPKSEDCLYLNVWAPKDGERHPVFIWIYGGANHAGEAALPEYDLSAFAREGVVGVSFNYRVGPLGFYNFKPLDDSFDSNCAVSDMLMALRWVHENIAAFGGDPENVTICGESAGGTAVYSLLAAPAARGLFQKAIPMSGLAGNVTTQRTHDLNNALFLKTLGLTEQEVGKLKDMSCEEMLKGGQAVLGLSNSVHQGIFITGPVIDDLVPAYPWEILEQGNARDVKCLIGTCRDEGNLFCTPGMAPKSWDEVKACLEENGIPDYLEKFQAVYGGMEELAAAQAWATDRMFWVDAMRCALAQSKHNTVYSYRFDFVPALCARMGLGATHSMDIAPALDTYASCENGFYAGTPMERVKDIHAKMHGAFLAFVKTGDPNGAVPLTWEPFTAEKRSSMVMDDTCKLIEDSNRARFDLWEPLPQLYR